MLVFTFKFKFTTYIYVSYTISYHTICDGTSFPINQSINQSINRINILGSLKYFLKFCSFCKKYTIFFSITQSTKPVNDKINKNGKFNLTKARHQNEQTT